MWSFHSFPRRLKHCKLFVCQKARHFVHGIVTMVHEIQPLLIKRICLDAKLHKNDMIYDNALRYIWIQIDHFKTVTASLI